jgi:hypothetical protein
VSNCAAFKKSAKNTIPASHLAPTCFPISPSDLEKNDVNDNNEDGEFDQFVFDRARRTHNFHKKLVYAAFAIHDS